MAKKKSEKKEIKEDEEIKKLEKQKDIEEQSKITSHVHHKHHTPQVDKKEEKKPKQVHKIPHHKPAKEEKPKNKEEIKNLEKLEKKKDLEEQSKITPHIHHKHKSVEKQEKKEHKVNHKHHHPHPEKHTEEHKAHHHIKPAHTRNSNASHPSSDKEQELSEISDEKPEIKVVKTIPLEERKLAIEKDIAMDFAAKVHKKFDRIVKCSILFGSQAMNTAKSNSDIDIILIIDDASLNWDLELISWYREELGKLISAQNYTKDLHINTIKLTTWWQDLIHGDAVVINVLRYGEALIDSGGFFNPLKALLLQGKMHSTPEAVYNALQRAPSHLVRSKLSILSSIEGVYWTMIDAAQAALITAGRLPPSPEHIPQMMKETFVDSGLLKINKIRALREIYVLHKGITHREIHEVKGEEIDRWQAIAESFLLEMTHIIDKLLESNKEKK